MFFQPRGAALALGEAVLRVADFDGAPVTSSYQTDEAQQVGERPGHVGGIVTTGKSPSAHLRDARERQKVCEKHKRGDNFGDC